MKMRLMLRLATLLVLIGAGIWYFSRMPATPSRVVSAEVVSLTDGQNGWRTITVRFENGEQRDIETLVPFFFKPGYRAQVGVFERALFADHYDIVGDWTAED